ncbi:hypothetical protein E2562_021698 [Oryza meyeriana var. granulata]|uniref:Uncharacterized protein n=1 Tax=Oryza meyeriana var. granulata TaxID=110450 RepID=A0A6G1E241_9ORYZ|nr:hypothetical protein E2562_021698 [Oryza meyeriana var. granulata]
MAAAGSPASLPSSPSQKPDPSRRLLLRCSPSSPAHSLLCWRAGSYSPSCRARLAVRDAEQEQASSCQQGGRRAATGRAQPARPHSSRSRLD